VLEHLSIDHDPAEAVELLRDSIVFVAYPDAAPALAGLRAAGVRTAVVSNADYTLPGMLAQAGLSIEHVFDSASCGSSKPDPGIFRRALAALRVDPRRALHVGDTPAADGDGARAAGVDVRIIDRTGVRPGSIASLTELPALAGAPA
jgi:putative hydrolase of the HAD superfamily